ncbi:MAG: hypothetical protein ABR923_10040 [Terracidiphilus sp.]
METMKVAWIVLLFAASALAQKPADGLPAVCGPRDAGFTVKLDRSQHALAEPEPGRACVYFIQDARGFKTNFGVDGAWVGASDGDSYFPVSMEPGAHHLCANIESRIAGHQMGLLHFTAEVGQTYYFRTRLFIAQGSAEYFEFEPIDSDEAGRMIATYPLSVSQAKK